MQRPFSSFSSFLSGAFPVSGSQAKSGWWWCHYLADRNPGYHAGELVFRYNYTREQSSLFFAHQVIQSSAEVMIYNWRGHLGEKLKVKLVDRWGCIHKLVAPKRPWASLISVRFLFLLPLPPSVYKELLYFITWSFKALPFLPLFRDFISLALSWQFFSNRIESLPRAGPLFLSQNVSIKPNDRTKTSPVGQVVDFQFRHVVFPHGLIVTRGRECASRRMIIQRQIRQRPTDRQADVNHVSLF